MRDSFSRDVLKVLVALARHHYDIAGLGALDGEPHRRRPIRFDASEVRCGKPGDDVGNDRVRVLRAGVVRSDDRRVRSRFDRFRHHRPLAWIAIASTAKDADETAAEMTANGGESGGERRRGMRKVDEDRRARTVRRRHALHPARHRHHATHVRHRFVQRLAGETDRRQGRRSVVNGEFAI